ncbi:MAG TPA: glucose-1-phosphate adenylyltransferase subunit GlgD [Lachnospiraceae bacterium]|nr:glucose-1-phosphate adenylyltransferase subunit GlgD [Lachnospiraceae bacterium]
MRAIGIILAGGNSERLKGLCKVRAIAAMPVAGSYRAIDFTLSNMSNSGITKVAVITQFNSRSLHDHLSSAKWWDLDRKEGGLYIFTPFLTSNNNFWFRGVADSIYQNISFLKRSHEPYVVIASGDAIYKMDYNKIIDYHVQKGSDFTIVYKNVEGTERDVHDYGVITLDEADKVTSFEEKPIIAKSSNISLGIYVIKRSLLIKLLESAIPKGYYDFVKDIICRNLGKITMYGYEFKEYWNTLNSVEAYMQTNMDFLKPEVRSMLMEEPYIDSKPSDDPPAKYNSGAVVKNSLIGTGTIIDGIVSNSVLFRKVFVGEGTTVNNSIVMKSSYIGKGCRIENAIIDKEVVIGDGKEIIGEPDNLYVVEKGTVV